MLEIYAGESALKTIKEKGFSPELFTSFLGASGGPKWFTLYGLDKYLFSEFFNNKEQDLNLIGSSVGAFRNACFAQKDPLAAIERLAKNYYETTYTDKAKSEEVSQKAVAMMDAVFGETGEQEIIDNLHFKAHFIVAKCNGFVGSKNKLLQGIGLAKSYVNNRISRPRLNSQYERFIFQSSHSDLQLDDPDKISTTRVSFSIANIRNALLASGSIPMVMEGINHIENTPKGMYRDGGIVDYHFDFAIKNLGLTLYPHFSSTLKAGWFDKNLSRKVRLKHYDNTVLICPSAKFIDALPHHKIPDRKDFVVMTREQRMLYWQQVMTDSEKLAESFDQFYQNQDISQIKNIKQLLA
ncbi:MULTISPECIES: patatin-like phospholipase family protein [unclassified Colwellia]|uniref:patatin-like phospholipase family protein n=1 Tax=unclassified Colwellia TaxID=196834 RepID=UPI0015F428C4|nr:MULTISPECIES: patatin-like phospholipase family protein [unclassified Colwellia]MBA6233844.1 patatin-like phospholipase family protein [Colwellia sp. MB02u-7]MBA6237340.1 patatin-like phospholipase family protein [Colwellia sp. MB02u-11]MBA6256470.1 patatin-like phospholipase family protein [Colwellia sp. MB3u-28]MBA6260327.1 patatin-like phospholipase family protein [Colwellia sp. MB3u-41]MBA6300340.1 patatin-like phospholipase family protein [Colwellia sp. MB3u-22]